VRGDFYFSSDTDHLDNWQYVYRTDYTSSPLIELYKVSYAWYGLIGVASSVLIGVLVSALTGGLKRSE